jgi:preprotein translocase subunit SecD
MKTTPALLILALIAVTASAIAETTVRFSEVCPENTSESAPMILAFRKTSEKLWVKNAPILTEQDIQSVSAFKEREDNGINITLTPDGAKKFKNGIKDMQGKRLAMIIDGRLVSAPVLMVTDFGNKAQIMGNLSEDEVHKIVSDINHKNTAEQGAAANP